MSIWDSLTSCFWFSAENQRNTFASILAGVLVNIVSLLAVREKRQKTMTHNFFLSMHSSVNNIIAHINRISLRFVIPNTFFLLESAKDLFLCDYHVFKNYDEKIIQM